MGRIGVPGLDDRFYVVRWRSIRSMKDSHEIAGSYDLECRRIWIASFRNERAVLTFLRGTDPGRSPS